MVIAGILERLTRFELALRAWKALVLPLHHSRLYPGRTNPPLPQGYSSFVLKIKQAVSKGNMLFCFNYPLFAQGRGFGKECFDPLTGSICIPDRRKCGDRCFILAL